MDLIIKNLNHESITKGEVYSAVAEIRLTKKELLYMIENSEFGVYKLRVVED